MENVSTEKNNELTIDTINNLISKNRDYVISNNQCIHIYLISVINGQDKNIMRLINPICDKRDTFKYSILISLHDCDIICHPEKITKLTLHDSNVHIVIFIVACVFFKIDNDWFEYGMIVCNYLVEWKKAITIIQVDMFQIEW